MAGILKYLGWSGLALVLAVPAWAAEPVGMVAVARGDVFGVMPGTTEKLPLSSKAPIYENETIVTGKRGQAQIVFTDETVFTVGRETEVRIDKFVFDPGTGQGQSDVNVGTGVFKFITGKIAKKEPDNVKFKTPSATIGVRGSGGMVAVTPRATSVALTQCCLRVSTPQGMVQLTQPNFVTVANMNQPPSPPVQMAPEMMQATFGGMGPAPANDEGGDAPPAGHEQGGNKPGAKEGQTQPRKGDAGSPTQTAARNPAKSGPSLRVPQPGRGPAPAPIQLAMPTLLAPPVTADSTAQQDRLTSQGGGVDFNTTPTHVGLYKAVSGTMLDTSGNWVPDVDSGLFEGFVTNSGSFAGTFKDLADNTSFHGVLPVAGTAGEFTVNPFLFDGREAAGSGYRAADNSMLIYALRTTAGQDGLSLVAGTLAGNLPLTAGLAKYNVFDDPIAPAGGMFGTPKLPGNQDIFANNLHEGSVVVDWTPGTISKMMAGRIAFTHVTTQDAANTTTRNAGWTFTAIVGDIDRTLYAADTDHDILNAQMFSLNGFSSETGGVTQQDTVTVQPDSTTSNVEMIGVFGKPVVNTVQDLSGFLLESSTLTTYAQPNDILSDIHTFTPVVKTNFTPNESAQLAATRLTSGTYNGYAAGFLSTYDGVADTVNHQVYEASNTGGIALSINAGNQVGLYMTMTNQANPNTQYMLAFGSTLYNATTAGQSEMLSNNAFVAGLSGFDKDINGDNMVDLTQDAGDLSGAGAIVGGYFAPDAITNAGVGCVQCQFLSWGFWAGELNDTATPDVITVAQLVPFVAGQMPGTPELGAVSGLTATYQGNVVGAIHDGTGHLSMAQGTFNANFTINSGSSVTMNNFMGHLGRTGAAADVITFTADTASATFNATSSDNRFAAPLMATGGFSSGTLQGSFFGPAAEELGGSITGTLTDGGQAAGVYFGKR